MRLRHIAPLLLVVIVSYRSQPGSAPVQTSASVDPVPSVESRVELGGGRYIDPAPGATPQFTNAQVRELAATMSTAAVQPIVIGYYHDTANDQPGAGPLLVYVIAVSQLSCVASAPAPPPGQTAVAVVTVPCNSALVVDATTGSTIIGIAGA